MAIISPLYFVVMAAIFASTIASTNDYCNVESCMYYGDLEDHTMCKYPPGPAAACGQVHKRGVSDDEKNRIVNMHNRLRQKVASGQETCGNPGPQPAAVRMPDLTWDDELQKIAQRWADQCDFSHDQCRNVDRFQVGQNIAMSFGNVPLSAMEDILPLIQGWYDEVCLFDSNTVSNFEFDPNTGHYTQMIWADTVKIGCGLISTEINGENKNILVCNYGPSGNWAGEKIYETEN